MSVEVVLGAGGLTGFECVKRLVDLGRNVRAVVRNPNKYKDEFPHSDLIEVVAGDVTQPESLRKALQGAKGVIFAASAKSYLTAASVDFQGVANVADVSKELGVERVVLVSSALVNPRNRFNPIRVLLNNIRWGLMDNKYKGEEYLRASGVAYTVVRPVGLTNDPPAQVKLHCRQGDKGAGPSRVARGDVAAVCVAALDSPDALNVTLELETAAPQQPAPADQLQSIFKGLLPGVN